MQLTVRNLNPNELQGAVALLHRSFEDTSFPTLFFPSFGTDASAKLAEMFELICRRRFATGQIMLGAFLEDELVAVASGDRPLSDTTSNQYASEWAAFVGSLDSTDGFHTYLQACQVHDKTEPFVYLGMLGTSPRRRGIGAASMLLERIDEVATIGTNCNGVWLDTITEDNVRYYEHRGYRTYAETELLDGKVWFMEKPVTKVPGQPNNLR